MLLPPWFWRILRSQRTKALVVCSSFLALAAVVLFYIGVNWWGERVFRKTVDELEAQGFPRTLEVALGPRVPDGLNFFKAPEFLSATTRTGFANSGAWYETAAIMKVAGDRSDLGGFPLPREGPRPLNHFGPFGIRHDPAISNTELARDLLGFLAPYEERRRGLVETCLRSGMSMPGNPQVPASGQAEGVFKSLDWFLSHYALTAAHAGEAGVAAESLVACWRIGAMPSNSPQPPNSAASLIMGRYHGLWVLRETIAMGIWSDDQLARFAEELAKVRPAHAAIATQACKVSLMMEGKFLGLLEFEVEEPKAVARMEISSMDRIRVWWERPRVEWRRDADNLWRKIRPRGFRTIDQAGAMKSFAHEILRLKQRPDGAFRAEDIARFGFSKLASTTPDQRFDDHDFPWRARELNHTNFLNFSLHAQVALKQEPQIALGRHALALERHRLRHGSHPQALAMLDADLQEGLPLDPMTGDAIQYRPEPDGGFTLWSVGLDLEDSRAEGDDISWRRQ